MTVVDASIVVRLLQNRNGDDGLRERMARHRYLDAPILIDAEVTSAIRGLLLTTKSDISISSSRADDMVADYADLPIVRHPLLPHVPRVLELRENFTAYDAFYVALAESLDMPLLTDDRKVAKATGSTATIETWRETSR